MVDAEVRAKCDALFRQWAVAYKSTPGMERIATLYKQLPQNRRPQSHQFKVLKETEADADLDAQPSSRPSPLSPSVNAPHTGTLVSSSSSTTRPATVSSTHHHSSSSIFKSSKDKKQKAKPFSLEREKPKILETIASASVASTNLINALKLINRETQQVSQNQEVMSRFETCKVLRRQILRYIQLVESDQLIGTLLTANDELVKALTAFEIMDKSVDDDSDSEADDAYHAKKAEFMMRTAGQRDAEEAFAGLNLYQTAAPAKPPRPTGIAMPPPMQAATTTGKHRAAARESEPEDEVDENDPFGDQNAVKTPHIEKSGMTWRDV